MNAVTKPETVTKKASKLKAVDPKAAEPSKPKILIFGKPGVGKTWASLDFPTCFYIDTESGADLAHYTEKLSKSGGVYFGPEQGSLDFNAVIEQVQALASEDHKYKTLIIDSFTKLFTTEVAREAERLGDKNAFGADKKPAVAQTRRLVSWLSRLDMNVVLICHEKPVWGKDEKGQQTQIDVTFDGFDKLEYELHLCLNIIKVGPNRLARIRKSRLTGFPDSETFPWNYEEFAKRYGKDVIERATVKLDLATDEQITEITKLISIVKLDESNKQDKWISENFANMSEVEAEKVGKIISYLKQKVTV